MSDNKEIIDLYTELAQNPNKDFGWDKGLDNAKAHEYKQEWLDAIPSQVLDFCAAVGNPFHDADIHEGDAVLDLGCGAGVDVLVASQLVGENGKVYGVDITPKIVELARYHAKLANAENVQILEASFDATNLEDESVDVIISNGAINLTSCKESVFKEIYRVLKPDGKIFFADMIDISEPSECCAEEKSSCCPSNGEDWANCVAGTMRENELIELIQKAGFSDVTCTGLTHYTTAKTTRGATFKATKIDANELRKKHWENIYTTRDVTQVFWYQPLPYKSIEHIKKHSNTNASIIDMGCGTSFLVDNLLDEGYMNISLLDISQTSLEIIKERIENQNIHFICSDILEFTSEKKYDLWHDRAVFHFLQDNKDKEKYFEVLSTTLEDNGTAVISTFKIDGDISCAGLDVVQYDADKIAALLPNNLKLIDYEDYIHTTPKNTQQKYIYFIIKKV